MPKADEPETAIVPLEQFRYPAALTYDEGGEARRLDGADGRNRAPAQYKNIDADDDLAAVWTWLKLRPESSQTFRAYRKESERFVLWAIFQRGKALSGLNVNDAIAYRDFLAALDPASGVPWEGPIGREQWIGESKAARGQDPWRPFAGPLAHRSQPTHCGFLKMLVSSFVQ